MKTRERIWLGALLLVLAALLFVAYILRLNEIQRDFIYAIGRGNIAEMERHHARGARVYSPWWHGLSPVHYAVSNDKPEALQWLIGHGAPLDEREYLYLRPAEWALQRNCGECFHILDKAGAPFDLSASGDETLLASAFQTDTYALRRVLEEGADPNGVDRYGAPVIFKAVRLLHSDKLDLLLNAGASINATDLDGNTMAHVLVLKRPELAPIMLPGFFDMGVDPTIENNVGDTVQEAYIAACDLYGLSPDATVVEMLNLRDTNTSSE